MVSFRHLGRRLLGWIGFSNNDTPDASACKMNRKGLVNKSSGWSTIIEAQEDQPTMAELCDNFKLRRQEVLILQVHASDYLAIPYDIELNLTPDVTEAQRIIVDCCTRYEYKVFKKYAMFRHNLFLRGGCVKFSLDNDTTSESKYSQGVWLLQSLAEMYWWDVGQSETDVCRGLVITGISKDLAHRDPKVDCVWRMATMFHAEEKKHAIVYGVVARKNGPPVILSLDSEGTVFTSFLSGYLFTC